MDSHDETGCRVSDGPILCVNNCGFFGSAATMNMCSKCHKALIMKQEQAKLASSSSIGSFVNGSSDGNGKEPSPVAAVDVQPENIDSKIALAEPSVGPSKMTFGGMKKTEGPNRCTTCRKRVGLTGFDCRCGNLFCADHRYSDKHECPFDYQAAARDAISKANPVVRAEKVDKI